MTRDLYGFEHKPKKKVYEPRKRPKTLLDFSGYKQKHGGDWKEYKEYLFKHDALSQQLYRSI